MSHAPELKALLSRGWTTREELLRTAFGGAVPGIAPDPEPVCFPLIFREMAEVYTKGALAETVGNHLRFGKENDPHERSTTLLPFCPTIRFRSDLASHSFVGIVFAHEGFHVLQDEDLLTDALIAPHRAGKTIGASRSFGHGPHLEAVLASEETPEQTALRHALLSKPYGEENTVPHLGNTNIYYLKHNEIESRMAHVFTACANHNGWKRMPQTPREVAGVLRIFASTPFPPLAAFPFNALLEKKDALKAAGDIRRNVVEKLSPAQRKAFFEKVLPEIYADFLERCGDLKIRAKLGLEPGIPSGRRAAREDGLSILPDVGVTAAEALLGLTAGTALGMAAGLLLWGNGKLDRIARPYLILAGTLPVFALAPVLIIWFGVGMLSKVVLAGAAVFLVALQQAYDGAAYAARHYRAYAQSLGAPHRRILTHIILPGSVDWTIAGFKMNVGFSLLGAFSGEFISSNAGVGHYILASGALYDMPRVFFGLGLLSLLGFILMGIPAFLRHFTAFQIVRQKYNK